MYHFSFRELYVNVCATIALKNCKKLCENCIFCVFEAQIIEIFWVFMEGKDQSDNTAMMKIFPPYYRYLDNILFEKVLATLYVAQLL